MNDIKFEAKLGHTVVSTGSLGLQRYQLLITLYAVFSHLFILPSCLILCQITSLIKHFVSLSARNFARFL